MEYTQNYALRKPGLNEYANVGDLNFNADKIDSQMKKNQDVDGEVYDPTSTAANAYEAGDYVINPDDGLMYVCNGTTYGTWDSTKWDHTTEFEEIQKAMASGGDSELADLTDVEITNPTEGQALLYDDTNDKWVNSDLPDADVTKTASGNPIEITDGADAPLVKCTTAIQGNQDLHGYDKPWVGGAGKNKLIPKLSGASSGGIVLDILPNGKYRVHGTNTASTRVSFELSNYSSDRCILPVGNYTISWVGSTKIQMEVSGTNYNGVTYTTLTPSTLSRSISVVNVDQPFNYITISVPAGETVDDTIGVQIESGSSATTFEPYSNICPITAYNQSTISVEDENEVVQQTSTATLSQSIYQGNADFVGGGSPSVQCDWPCIDLGDLTWDRGATNISGKYRFYANLTTALQADTAHLTSVCETYGLVSEGATFGCANGYTINSSSGLWVYDSTKDNMTKEEFKSSVTGVKLTYRLATPTTETITPTNTPIKSLFGYNHIESSTGEMEIEYFPAKEQPLIDLIPEASNMHTYSTEEHAVGTWVDGSTIYERSIDLGSFSIGSEGTYIIEQATDIDLLIDYDGYVIENSIMYALPDPSIRIKMDSNKDLIFSGTASWYVSSGYLTIRYTKTASNNRSLAKSAPQEETKEEQVEELKEEPTEEIKEEPEEEVEKAKEEETKEEAKR